MVRVDFLGPIDRDSLELDISSLRELANILKEIDGLEEWLDNSAVAVNNEIILSLDRELKNGDIISILPPVCGG
jgi:molybdopterin synthase sulfur carrier subunit